MVAYEARTGQTLEVEDAKLRGTQHVTFKPGPEGVEVTLALEYEIKDAQRCSPRSSTSCSSAAR